MSKLFSGQRLYLGRIVYKAIYSSVFKKYFTGIPVSKLFSGQRLYLARIVYKTIQFTIFSKDLFCRLLQDFLLGIVQMLCLVCSVACNWGPFI